MKLPFSFDLKFLFRILLPGFVLALGLIPLLERLVVIWNIRVGLEYLVVLLSVLIGWGYLIADMHVYMLIEGRRYWPPFLRKYFIKRKLSRLEAIRRELERVYKKMDNLKPGSAEYISNYNRYIELSVKIRTYPVDDNGERTVYFPTTLGNIIFSYENYPNVVYGMDAIFYWYRIWLKLDKDLRQQLDDQQGLTDSTVYTTFSLLGNGILFLVYTGLASFTNFFDGYVIQKGGFALIAMLCFGLGYLIYRISFQVHMSYGNLFKSMFDQFREVVPVDEMLNSVKEVSPDLDVAALSEREQYQVAWRYLHNYTVDLGGGVRKSIRSLLKEKKK